MVLASLTTVAPQYLFSTLLNGSLQFTASQRLSVRMHHTSHALFYVRHAAPQATRLTCVCNGRSRDRVLQSGFIKFQNADDELRTYFGNVWPRDHIDALLIPVLSVRTVVEQEDVAPSHPEIRSFERSNDGPLQQSLSRVLRLLRAPASPHLADHAEAATRELLLRVLENGMGYSPTWRHDTSAFASETFRYLLELIDANLAVPPRLEDLAAATAFSQSHFARKFRNSTGQSLHRFINTRRVQFAVRQLTASHVDLPSLSLDLGFSSQSHFTRVFKAVTGMTPAHLRR